MNLPRFRVIMNPADSSITAEFFDHVPNTLRALLYTVMACPHHEFQWRQMNAETRPEATRVFEVVIDHLCGTQLLRPVELDLDDGFVAGDVWELAGTVRAIPCYLCSIGEKGQAL